VAGVKVLPRLTLAAVCALALGVCNKPPPDPDDVGGRAGGGGSTSSGGSPPPAGGGSGAPGTGAAGGGSGTGGGAAGGGSGTGGGAAGGGSGTGGGAAGGAGGGTGGRPSSPDAADAAAMGGAGGGAVDPLPPGVQGHPNPAIAYPKYPGFTLALAEEFDQPIDLDRDPIWTWSDGGLSEGRVRFVEDGISFRDGKMVITARAQPIGLSPSYAEPVLNGDRGEVAAKPVRSGELRTKFNNYRYGRYEVRLKPPVSAGNFISTLFVFRTPKFENWREIDIELTADRPGSVVTNLIFAEDTGGWHEGIQELADRFPAGPGAMGLPAGFNHQTAFHTYAFEWVRDRITWYVDGVPIRVKTAGGGKPIPERSAKIIMNLWIFDLVGGFGGDPTRNQYPMSAEYEWFRFYRWDQEATYPCAGPPACLPGEDMNKSKNNPDDGLPP
jgi:endo-1,3-1,4-beta-glycanase ExoK